MSITKTALKHCKCCQTKLNASTPVNGVDKPRHGDVTLCYRCGALYQFDKNMDLVSLDENSVPPELLEEALMVQKQIRNSNSFSNIGVLH